MMAILKAIHAFGIIVKNKALQIVTGNISAMANKNYMGGHLLTLLQKPLTLHISCFCLHNGDPSSLSIFD